MTPSVAFRCRCGDPVEARGMLCSRCLKPAAASDVLRSLVAQDPAFASDSWEVVHRCRCGERVGVRGELCSSCSAAERAELREMVLCKARRSLPPWERARFGRAEIRECVHPRILEAARSWSIAGGLGLTLLGYTGAGKTTAALAIAHHRLETARTPEQVRFASGIRYAKAPTLAVARAEGELGKDEPAKLKLAKSCALLILDEVGSEPDARKGEPGAVYEVLQARADRGLLSIVCAGFTEAELHSRYGDATKRRLTERSVVVGVTKSEVEAWKLSLR